MDGLQEIRADIKSILKIQNAMQTELAVFEEKFDNHETMEFDFHKRIEGHLMNDLKTKDAVRTNTNFRKGASTALWSVWVVVLGVIGKLFWQK